MPLPGIIVIKQEFFGGDEELGDECYQQYSDTEVDDNEFDARVSETPSWPVFDTSPLNSEAFTQTEELRCLDCASHASLETKSQWTQAVAVTEYFNKEVQTTENADGFYFSIDTLKGLSVIQRKAIRTFKVAMGINDDAEKETILELFQHQTTNLSVASAWQPSFTHVKEEFPWRVNSSTLRNPSPPPDMESINMEDFAPFRYKISPSSSDEMPPRLAQADSRENSKKDYSNEVHIPGRGRGRRFY